MTDPSPTDADLVARSIGGDQSAFSLIARQHGPRLAKVVRGMGVSPSEVEDVVQTAFVDAWRALAEFDCDRSLGAWLTVIAANKARDWSRRRKIRLFWLRSGSVDDAEARGVSDPEMTPERAEHHVELMRVQRAIDKLPEGYRTILVVACAGGLKQAEAAEALGISRKALEGRLARARIALNRELAKNTTG